MTSSGSAFPRFRPVAERAVLAEFGETVDEAAHGRVLALDAALRREPFPGLAEAVPAYVSLLVVFDPLVTDHRTVEAALAERIATGGPVGSAGQVREVEVCYDGEFAPDLPAVAATLGLAVEDVIERHLAGDYGVAMYGFAPGYAYLAGVPEAIRVPRKTVPVRDVPAGSVLIAGPQCLVSTVLMPTGWWIIGRSPTRILDRADADRPFLFEVGDRVRFRRIEAARLRDGSNGARE